jgi:hypothetical protein
VFCEEPVRGHDDAHGPWSGETMAEETVSQNVKNVNDTF